MLRVLFAILAGLFGAALLHLVIILSLPHFTGKDAATRVASEGDLDKFYLLGGFTMTRPGLSNDDPFVRTAVCALRYRGKSGPPDRQGQCAVLVDRAL